MIENGIDILLSADTRLSYDYGEFMTLGAAAPSANIFHELKDFVPMCHRPSIIHVLRCVLASDKLSRTQKIFHLEAIACDLTSIAEYLGILKAIDE